MNLRYSDSAIFLEFMEFSLLHWVYFKLTNECACICQPRLAFSMADCILPLPRVELPSTHITRLCQWIHIYFVSFIVELSAEVSIGWPAVLHSSPREGLTNSCHAGKWSLEFAVSEQPNTLKRFIVIFAVRVNELYTRWTIGDSIVESAHLQCDFVLRNLVDWFNRDELLIRMYHFPLEVCLALKSVHSELFDVVVEGEAFRDCMLLLTINIILWQFYLEIIKLLCHFCHFIWKLL
jgi:hypothetical protein